MNPSHSPTLARAIGDRPIGLIKHLRATVDLLLDQGRSGYCWTSCRTCNAGLLARVIMGYSKEELGRAFPRYGEWSYLMDAEQCPHNPGTPWAEVLDRLFATGLDRDDFIHVESLNHPELIHPDWTTILIDNKPFNGVTRKAAYNDPQCVAWYLANWATKIEAFHAAHPVAVAGSVTETSAIEVAATPILSLVSPATLETVLAS